MSATAFALIAAFTLVGATIYTKRLAMDFPHHQLIGPLLLLNSALVAPFGALVHWHLGWRILALHAASALALGIGSYCIFDLFAHGSAAAVAVGTAMTPMPALIFSALLLCLAGDRLPGDGRDRRDRGRAARASARVRPALAASRRHDGCDRSDNERPADRP